MLVASIRVAIELMPSGSMTQNKDKDKEIWCTLGLGRGWLKVDTGKLGFDTDVSNEM